MQSTYNHTYVNSLVCDGHFVTGVLLSDVVREKPGLVRCDSSPVQVVDLCSDICSRPWLFLHSSLKMNAAQ